MTSDRMVFIKTVHVPMIKGILEEWQAGHPKMGILALLPEAEQRNVPALQAIFREKGILLVGGVFPGLLADGHFYDSGVVFLRFDEMPLCALYPNLNAPSPRNPVDDMAEAVKAHLDEGRDATLLMIFDAMVPNIATILDDLYLKLADRVHYMGANAGSETFRPMPCLFDNHSIVKDGVLVILMKHHAGAILEHGYRVPARMITATSTVGNRLINIDWRPAFEVYQEMAKAQYGVTITRENFYRYAVAFPFGIMRADGVILVRIPVALTEDGSLFCVGEVPPNALLTLLRSPEVDSLQTARILADGLTSLNGPRQDRELLLFYCAGRRIYLGLEKAQNELLELGRLTRTSRIAGALSLGEIGSSRLGGYPLFHNAALVSCCWGEDCEK